MVLQPAYFKTVEPVVKDHHESQQKVVLRDRWPWAARGSIRWPLEEYNLRKLISQEGSSNKLSSGCGIGGYTVHVFNETG